MQESNQRRGEVSSSFILAPSNTPKSPPGLEGPRRTASARIIVLVLIAIVVLAAAWVWLGSNVRKREVAAAARLSELGALIVKDSDQTHVASVNLSVIGVQAESKENSSPLSVDQRLDRAVGLLRDLPELISLDASRTSFGDRHTPIVGQLTSLKSLTFANTGVTDTGLSHLSGLRRLEALNMGHTPISGAGLRSLGQLRNVKVLDLSGTQVRNGLEHLQQLTNLEWLVLRTLEQLDPGALQPLADCHSLVRLSLDGTSVPEADLTALRTASPKLKISMPAPVDGADASEDGETPPEQITPQEEPVPTPR